MEWFRALTDAQATVIVSAIGTVTAIIVAFFAANLATRKDTRMKMLERQFGFRDRREQEYAEFISKMNRALQDYFEIIELMLHSESATASLAELRKIEHVAQDLDAASMKLRIAVPRFVSHAVLQVNGRIQHAVLSLRNLDAEYPLGDQFEHAKNNMLKAMEADLDRIEDAKDRDKYRKKVLAENTRYIIQTKAVTE
jgi:hypothetical protein